MEKISVIVPVYKVENYLSRCVESIVKQTYSELEIILVDDGSPDNCPALCDAWAKKDSRIRVVHKINGGLSDARNAGMAIATGEYISFVDSDDWIAPDFFLNLINAIQKDGSDIACCAVKMVWENGSPERMLTVQENTVLERSEAQKELLNEGKLKQPVWYKLYKRELICHIPFEKGKYHEDVFWSYQAIGNAQTISLIDYIGYYYWQRCGSIMGESYSLKRLDAMEAYCRRYEYIKQNFPELEVSARLAVLLKSIYNGQMALKYLPEDDQKKAFSYLNAIKGKYPVSYKDCAGMKITHRLWTIIARYSLRFCCRIKNRLGIGL